MMRNMFKIRADNTGRWIQVARNQYAATSLAARQHRPSSTGPVVGCGSNVVDHFFLVKSLPKPGEKGFFASPTRTLEDSIVGGVTLNHLSWAATLGVPTALMALQGNDPSGRMIRAAMKRIGLSTEFVQVSDDFVTAESYVLSELSGERSIIMASGQTSKIDAAAASKYFSKAVANASLLTTEISQVPLSGVHELLKMARKHNKLSFLDIDVSPTVALTQAMLGSKDELVRCVKRADVLKPAKHAAEELVQVLRPDKAVPSHVVDLSQVLLELTGAQMVAMTDGAHGCAIAVMNREPQHIAAFPAKAVVDTTGAGDAFLGGLVAGLYHMGGDIPSTDDKLQSLARLANAAGVACCETRGALPAASASSRILELVGNDPTLDIEKAVAAGTKLTQLDTQDEGVDSVFRASMVIDADAAAQVRDMVDQERALHFVNGIADTIDSPNRIFVTGIGKSGCVARRMAVSLTSLGCYAQFVHATEWAHGDLGGIRPGDVVIAFSHSGNTQETVFASQLCKDKGAQIFGVVGSAAGKLAQLCHEAIVYTIPPAAEPVGGAPTASIVAQEMVVNAVMNELIERRNFSTQDFAANHPGGALGERLLRTDAK